MIANMKRREFITLIGGVAAWRFAARAQQECSAARPPVTGRGRCDDLIQTCLNFLRSGTPDRAVQTPDRLGYESGRDSNPRDNVIPPVFSLARARGLAPSGRRYAVCLYGRKSSTGIRSFRQLS